MTTECGPTGRPRMSVTGAKRMRFGVSLRKSAGSNCQVPIVAGRSVNVLNDERSRSSINCAAGLSYVFDGQWHECGQFSLSHDPAEFFGQLHGDFVRGGIR